MNVMEQYFNIFKRLVRSVSKPCPVCDHDAEGIRSSLKDAIVIAETAVSVLDSSFDNEKVQKMAKWILGDDALFGQKVDRAKLYLKYLTQIDKVENTDIMRLGSFADETDVIIYCDQSNYETRNNLLFDKIIGKPVEDPDSERVLRDCYDPSLKTSGTTAMTSHSSDYDTTFLDRYKDWVKGGRQGIFPMFKEARIPHKDKPCTTNICVWSEAGDFLPDDETATPIDSLLNTLTGTLLHELTHTISGGNAMDDDEDGDSYGWDDIGRLKNADNSDSINALGICMYLFSKGYWVDDDGDIQKL
ncbi:hypothetical protein CC79DRAFT_1388793 [Sarocladium strictum]